MSDTQQTLYKCLLLALVLVLSCHKFTILLKRKYKYIDDDNSRCTLGSGVRSLKTQNSKPLFQVESHTPIRQPHPTPIFLKKKCTKGYLDLAVILFLNMVGHSFIYSMSEMAEGQQQ